MNPREYLVLISALILAGVTHVRADEVKLETLMKAQLEGVEETEVIVSKVQIPANTSLPKHWHPGEEFVYILEGSVTLWQKDKKDIVGTAGELIKVPLKQIHTGITGNAGASLLVFRVHEQGQPERVMVE
jgi:quercetin dioxygenase-like cupin family protein